MGGTAWSSVADLPQAREAMAAVTGPDGRIYVIGGAVGGQLSKTVDSYDLFFSSRRRHTRFDCDWSSDVCSSDLPHRLSRVQGRVGVLEDHLHVPPEGSELSALQVGDVLPVEEDPPFGHRVQPHHQSRSEEHTSELQSQSNLVCRLLLEKKKITYQ